MKNQFITKFIDWVSDELFLWQARRLGTHYQNIWETPPSAETVLENSWRRFCLQRIVMHIQHIIGSTIMCYTNSYYIIYYITLVLFKGQASGLCNSTDKRGGVAIRYVLPVLYMTLYLHKWLEIWAQKGPALEVTHRGCTELGPSLQ